MATDDGARPPGDGKKDASGGSTGVGALFARAVASQKAQGTGEAAPVPRGVELMTCPRCGAPRKREELTCHYCGSALR